MSQIKFPIQLGSLTIDYDPELEKVTLIPNKAHGKEEFSIYTECNGWINYKTSSGVEGTLYAANIEKRGQFKIVEGVLGSVLREIAEHLDFKNLDEFKNEIMAVLIANALKSDLEE